MDLGNFSLKNLRKGLFENKVWTNFVNNFIKELSKYLQTNQTRSNNPMSEEDMQNIQKLKSDIQEINDKREIIRTTTRLMEGKNYVVSDIRDDEIMVVDVENGDEIKVYISTDEESIKKLHSIGIYDRIYQMDKQEFLNLNLTDNIFVEKETLHSNCEKIEIRNNRAWRLLENLYIGEIETEGKRYEVIEITDNKIYLTNVDGSGGHFSIHKELYPNFVEGDILQKNNRKFKKIN